MKRKNKILGLFILLMATFSCTTQGSLYSQMGDQEDVDFQLFYDQLSPYGQWIDYPEYGYVWVPDAGPGFAPYDTNGYWVNTDYGWTWVSDYPWGWAAFHYGRWDYDGRLGWFWVPGDEWGPAWVSWRQGGGYYGWAPMRPGMRVGYYNDYGDINRWHFVRDRDFGRPHIRRYEMNHRDYENILRSSRVIDNTHIDRRRNTTYIAGPSPEEVQRVTGRRIGSLAVRDNPRPGTIVKRDQISIYRPNVQPGTRGAATPTRVSPRNQVNPNIRRNPQDNIYLPNERRADKMQQYEQKQQIERQQNQRQTQMEQQQQIQQRQMEQRQIQEQNSMTRRQQRLEQRRMETEQNNNRPFGQQKREEYRQQREQKIQQQQTPQIEQQQPQQNPAPENGAPWERGRRR